MEIAVTSNREVRPLNPAQKKNYLDGNQYTQAQGLGPNKVDIKKGRTPR